MKPILTLMASLALLGCKGNEGPVTGQSSVAAGGELELQGAGATFPYPLYSKWIAEYQKIDPQVRINYQSIGSGGGIRQILERTVDFGASDAPMTEAELGKARAKLLHIPMTLGAVVVTYNVPGVSARLRLSPEVVAGIFLGELKTWNAPPIAALNPEAKLPATAITVVHRSDGSGTTAVFTEYLAKVSADWKSKVGAGKSVKFPLGLGAKGNEGVSGQVKTTPSSIGYVELAYAKQTGLAYAALRNRAGAVLEPTPENIAAAAASVASSMPEDLRVSIVDAPGEKAYPISAFTYILVYEDQGDARKGKALAQFLWWATHDGQKLGPPLDYARLPAAILPKVEASLRKLEAGKKPLLAGEAR
jgi:phosphate transport system substrate-binding protein